MKLKSKLLLASTCLLTMSVAASATSAYAWIVANRQAFVDIKEVAVSTNATGLKVAAKQPTDNDTNNAAITAADTSSSPMTLVSKTGVKVTDISGDGKTFYKPTFYADNNPEKVKATTAVANSAGTKYYHQFHLEFTQTNATATTAILLSPETKIAANTVDNGALNAYRIAILDAAEENVLWYYAPNRTKAELATEQPLYVSGAGTDVNLTVDDEPGNIISPVSGITKLLTKAIGEAGSDPNGFRAPKSYVQDFTTEQGYLGTLTSAAAFEITVRIWLEGQDSDCLAKILNDTVDLSLKFDGYDASNPTA